MPHVARILAQDGAEWAKHQLSDAQVEQFWSQGYLSNIPVLSEEQCEKLLKDYRTFLVRRILTSGCYVDALWLVVLW